MLINKILVALLFATTACIIGCGDDSKKSSVDANEVEKSTENDEPIEEEWSSSSEGKSIEGFIWIPVTDTAVVLGTNDSSAKTNEKPEMNVVLDYDFYMGMREVSCGDYAVLIKSQGLKKIEGCDSDSLPIVNFNYYDAVLLANAQSKQMDYDTIYSYTTANFDNDNHCTYLEGLNFHPDREGFRLPTEAEWLRVASLDWNVDNSWNADNSDYKVHNVCSKKIDAAGFCDLSGNVMEWVNDWLGNFRDTTVSNYMGNTDGGDIGERVLKGGSFRLNASSINKYNRGDVYMVTSTSFGDYVGFRLALGKIENPVWLNKNGSAEQSKVTTVASVMSIKNVVGSYSVKLAFRNDVTGNLVYVDYLEGGGSVVEIADTINVYHPEISPNGSHVAFCTKLEGVSGKSSLYVRELDEEGSNLIKLDVESAAIPRWHVSAAGDTSIIYVTDAGINSESLNWKSNSTWQVPFMNGMFGTSKKIFDGSYHGGLSEDEKFTVTGARLLRARIDDKDELWLNGEQACNASLAMDGSKRTLFLDFGSKTGKAFVGQSYGVHEQILIADSTGNLIQSIAAPDGYSFDHSEWTTDGVKSNIVATLTNINGAHEKIVLVNVNDSSVIDLVTGDEIWHPSLWVKKKAISSPVVVQSSSSEKFQQNVSSSYESSSSESSLDISSSSGTLQVESSNDVQNEPSSSDDYTQNSSGQESSSNEDAFVLDADSAGIYYLPGGTEAELALRYKMELLWNYRDSANVVILGSSRSYYGVDPTLLSSNFWGINLAVPTFALSGTKYFFDNYVLPHMNKMKYLIISIDIDRGYHTFDDSFFYEDYKKYAGYVYDVNHNFWNEAVPDDLASVTYDSPGVGRYAWIYRPSLGHHSISNAVNWGGDNPTVATDSNWYDNQTDLYNANFDLLVDLVKKSAEKNIYVIGVIFPQSPGFKNT